MGRKPLDAARCVVEMAELPLDAADFNQELYQSLENVFPEAELMPGLYIYTSTCAMLAKMFSVLCTLLYTVVATS